jgi:hypothetical protein
MTFKRREELFLGAGVLYAAMFFAGPRAGQCEVHGATATDTLGAARLSASVKGRIYRELSDELEPSGGVERSVLANFGLKMIKLSPDGYYGVRVWGGPNREGFAPVCGATGNCPIWVFDQRTGGLLLSGDGFELRLEPTMHRGRYDLLMRANMSAGSGVRDWYQFDGHTYQHVQQTDETY